LKQYSTAVIIVFYRQIMWLQGGLQEINTHTIFFSIFQNSVFINVKL